MVEAIYLLREGGIPIVAAFKEEKQVDVGLTGSLLSASHEQLKILIREIERGELHKSLRVKEIIEEVYKGLKEKGIEPHGILVLGPGLKDIDWESPDRKYRIIARRMPFNDYYIAILEKGEVPDTVIDKVKGLYKDQKYKELVGKVRDALIIPEPLLWQLEELLKRIV